jgi:predicted nucleic acid-binding protein
MKLIIDSNILISALIKDSVTREIIIKSEWDFYYPELAFHEIRKYQKMILEKSGMYEAEYSAVISRLLKHITIVPEEQFSNYISKANDILRKIDPNYVIFLALAMSVKDSKIWSNDSHLHMQREIKTLKTEEILRLIE